MNLSRHSTAMWQICRPMKSKMGFAPMRELLKWTAWEIHAAKKISSTFPMHNVFNMIPLPIHPVRIAISHCTGSHEVLRQRWMIPWDVQSPKIHQPVSFFRQGDICFGVFRGELKSLFYFFKLAFILSIIKVNEVACCWQGYLWII